MLQDLGRVRSRFWSSYKSSFNLERVPAISNLVTICVFSLERKLNFKKFFVFVCQNLLL